MLKIILVHNSGQVEFFNCKEIATHKNGFLVLEPTNKSWQHEIPYLVPIFGNVYFLELFDDLSIKIRTH